MSVKPQDFHKVQNAPAMKIFAIIIDLYGRKMADEIAEAVVRDEPGHTVVWPTVGLSEEGRVKGLVKEAVAQAMQDAQRNSHRGGGFGEMQRRFVGQKG